MRSLVTALIVLSLWVTPMAGAQTTAMDWAELGTLRPDGVQHSADVLGRQIAVAPGDPRRLAFCTRGGISLSTDAGQTWTFVPTDVVTTLAAATPYPLAPRFGGAPACAAVTLDPTSPAALYASFWTLRAPQDAAPPTFAAGYYTADAGQTWRPAPVPAGLAGQTFGGFRADALGVRALYGPGPILPIRGHIAPPTVELTVDGGQTWSQVPFACPAVGPCVQWGLAPSELTTCAMHGFGQLLFTSEDGGQTWTSPEGAAAANACEPNALVALSATTALLLTPGPSDVDPQATPARISRDSGRTWVPLSLPALPSLRQLELLPDGRLLAFAEGWWLLAAGANTWCQIPDDLLPTFPTPLTAAGDQLWWLDPDADAVALPVMGISCAVSPS